MKIGILTFHTAHNYGAMLQTYALKITCEKLGHETHVINYTPKYISDQYRYFKPKKNIKSDILALMNLRGNVVKNKRFEEFKNQYFDMRPFAAEEYDAILYGSDQIWNPNIAGGFDSVFFAEHCVKARRHVAYAASVGKQEFSEEEYRDFQRLVKNFDAVSVREESAARYLQPLFNRPIEVTLDPTLMTGKKDWEGVMVCPNRRDKYILIYEVALFPETLAVAKALSEQTGFPIVRILYTRTKLQYGYQTMNDLGPCEFLGWIRNAEYVVTSSFHGTAFSLLFGKNFYTIPHHSYASRMTDLLAKLNLSDRLVHSLPEKIVDVDYDKVEKKLMEEREKSLAFIKKSID